MGSRPMDRHHLATSGPQSSCRGPARPGAFLRSTALGAGAISAIALTGCIERTIRITSEPPGALVYLNDLEVGRTPTEVGFEYYGTYDIRLVMDGYETWVGPAKTPVPLYDYPIVDLVAEVAPVRFNSVVEWHFDLDPVRLEPEAMVDRAQQLRARLDVEIPDGDADSSSGGTPADVAANAAARSRDGRE